METKPILEEAKVEDAEELLSIYAPYVKNTAISFETEVPSLEEFRRRISTIQEKYPYLLVRNPETREILGYCYASAFQERKAYSISAELSIYIKEGYHHKGYGRLLYQEIEKRLVSQGIVSLYAIVTCPSEEGEDPYLPLTSPLFHKGMGYKEVGHLHRCGKKFSRYYDILIFEKHRIG